MKSSALAIVCLCACLMFSIGCVTKPEVAAVNVPTIEERHDKELAAKDATGALASVYWYSAKAYVFDTASNSWQDAKNYICKP